MNKEEIMYCVEVHKKVVMTQVLDTKKLRKAANLIRGVEEDTLSNPSQDRQTIYSWYVRHADKMLADMDDLFGVDKTDTNTPAVTPPKEEQSHSEDVHYVGIKETPPIDFEAVEKAMADEIQELEEEYKTADTNGKRSITMRIKALKKKLNA